MHAYLDELRQLEVRAESLSQMGSSVTTKCASEDDAKAEYKGLKQHLELRLKEFERRESAHVDDWLAATFASALRSAHIAMRSPTNTSPKNSGWLRSVDDAREELSYAISTWPKE
ncbi:hypothetical protein [Hydrogenophaga sp.]|uniref:hypothetical protein n=1 Tax=Hydrogenophaga sp. TaxID=1904254 RepID=UPI0025C3F2B7|nr:hypothetical protein [Hydrogenophaga sp.]MBT9462533.1 hypothetical protein [Hydrogenophaga sp.]